MPIYVLSNIPSMNAQKNVGIAQRALNQALERLSSGKRINRAQDDPAGLLMATKMQQSITAWGTGANNLRMGLDLLSTADSFINIIMDDVVRLNELANQACNGLLDSDARALLQKEVAQILPEINRLATNTKFMGQNLLTGSLMVSVRAGEGSLNAISIAISELTYGGGGLNISTITVGGIAEASAARDSISTALMHINSMLAQIGSQASAFQKSIDATDALVQNMTAARSRIVNADLAEETTNLTNSQIVVQSGISALVQANSAQTLALALLGGK